MLQIEESFDTVGAAHQIPLSGGFLALAILKDINCLADPLHPATTLQSAAFSGLKLHDWAAKVGGLLQRPPSKAGDFRSR